MKHYYDVAFQTQTGGTLVAAAGTSVAVYLAGTLTTATIYSDDGLTLKSNPFTTDTNGRFDFYVADGRYDLNFSGPNITPFTQSNVEISDVTEASVTKDASWNIGNANVDAALTSVGGSLSGTFAGTHGYSGAVTFTGANIHSGPETFTGPLNSNNLAAGNVANKNASTDAILYVSGTGNDANDGLSWGTAKAKIKTAVAALPTINSKPSGIVFIGQGVNIASGDEITIGPWTKLIFTPQNSVTYNGTGTPISCNDAPTTYAGDGGIYGLDLNVTNNAGSGLNIQECTWFKLSQVNIVGPGTSATGIPILLQNTQKWTEQTDLDTVHVSNFVKPITFQDNCPGNTGCPSFSYARWRHVVVSPVGVGGKGYELQNDSGWNGGDLEIQCFGNASNAITCLSLIGTANIQLNRLKVGGEGNPGPSNVGISTVVGTQFSPINLWERWNSGTWSDSISGTFIPYIFNVPGLGQIIANPAGLRIANTTNSFDVTLDSTLLTIYRTVKLPDASGIAVLDTATQTLTNKSTSAGPLTGTVASGTATMTTAAITAGNCGTTVTVAATNVLTTDTITWAFNAAPAGSNSGLVAWPTAGNVNFAYCPNSAETPAAATINWKVIR